MNWPDTVTGGGLFTVRALRVTVGDKAGCEQPYLDQVNVQGITLYRADDQAPLRLSLVVVDSTTIFISRGDQLGRSWLVNEQLP